MQAPFDLEIRTAGNGENETFTVIDAEDAGRNVIDGGALGYKIFATDFDIADDEDLIDQIVLANLPRGATLITIDVAQAVDSENPTPASEYPTSQPVRSSSRSQIPGGQTRWARRSPSRQRTASPHCRVSIRPRWTRSCSQTIRPSVWT